MKWLLKFLMINLMVLCSSHALVMAEEAPLPTSDQEAMMAKMQAMMTPGPEHALLEDLEGEWTYTAKFWMTPEAPAEETVGTSDQYMIFDGRFLEQDIEGTWMDKPFEGVGFLGYDKMKGEYTSIWFDNMSTSFMMVAGQYDAATKTINFSGTMACPMTGNKNQPVRSEYILTDESSNIYNSYTVDADGKEFKSMEIHYTREI